MTVYLAEWKLAAELNLSIITSWRRFFCVVLVSWCSHESRSNSWKTPCCPAKLNINTLVTNERTVYWPVLTSVLLWKQTEPRKCIIFNPFLQVWQQYFSEFSSSVAQWCMKHRRHFHTNQLLLFSAANSHYWLEPHEWNLRGEHFHPRIKFMMIVWILIGMTGFRPQNFTE